MAGRCRHRRRAATLPRRLPRRPQDTAAGDEASNTTGAEANKTEGADTSQSDAGSTGDSGKGTPPQLAQGGWEGTLHFEVSGDVDLSADMPGGGVTQGEFSLLTFAADDGSGASQIAVHSRVRDRGGHLRCPRTASPVAVRSARSAASRRRRTKRRR